MSTNELTLGVDFGTSNSCSAIMINGNPVIVPDGSTQQKEISTVICYKENAKVLFGEFTENNMKEFVNSTIFESKKLLGFRFNDKKKDEIIKNSNVKIEKR